MHLYRGLALAAVGLLTACSTASAAVHLNPAVAPLPTDSEAPAGLLAAVPIATPNPTPAPTPVNSYHIGTQDTVSSVASYFGLTIQQIVDLNPGLEVNPDEIHPGDVLAVAPGGTSQLVQPRTPPTPKPTPVTVGSYIPIQGVLWTFDDCEYSQGGIVARYIQVLRAHGVGQSIFFMTGQCYYSRPDLVGLIKQAGYTIGNHSYSHLDLTKLSPSDLNYQIVNGPPGARYFRPPYGARNATVDTRIAAYGYVEMMWSASGGDSGTEGLKRTCSRILQDLVSTIKGNAVVLLHMFNPSSPGAVDAYLSGRSSC